MFRTTDESPEDLGKPEGTQGPFLIGKAVTDSGKKVINQPELYIAPYSTSSWLSIKKLKLREYQSDAPDKLHRGENILH